MQTLYDKFGRYSYDGIGGIAKVIVDARRQDRYDERDNGYSGILVDGVDWSTWGEGASLPRWAVAFYRSGSRTWSYAAALDLVAHEWGHAVVSWTTGWPYSGPSVSLQEGFADFFGYAVEWLAPRPQNCVVECPDWTFGEDAGGIPSRRVDLYQDKCGYALHAGDCPNVQERHVRGNVLPVAFRLLADGVKNPLCDSPKRYNPEFVEACKDANKPDEQGLETGAQILYRAVVYYATSVDTWEDLPYLARWVAFTLYEACEPPWYDAVVSVQESVRRAFVGIGYASALPPAGVCPGASFPAITSISPSQGPSEGGTSVTITGSGFSAGTMVHIGDTPAVAVNVLSPNSITALTAPHAPGAVNVQVTNPSGLPAFLDGGFSYLSPAPTGYYLLNPCRVLDTRNASGPDAAAPPLSKDSKRTFTVTGRCGIPSTARSLAVNVTVANATGSGVVRIVPGNSDFTGGSRIAFSAGQVRGNNARVLLSTAGNGTISVDSSAPGQVDLIFDVFGFFQ